MKRRWKTAALAILCLGMLAAAAWQLPDLIARKPEVPGLQPRERTLLRIWVTGSPGGGQPWLVQQLRAFEKQHPGVMTHLRIVRPEDVFAPEAVLPDVLLFLPGDLADTSLLAPITADSGLRPELLAAGRLGDVQYGLPLCWGAWVLAIDSALEPGHAATPAPTTLLGKPSATAAPQEAPGYPLAAAASADVALQSPGGAALLTLSRLLPPGERPPLPQDLGQLSTSAVYDAFRARKCATAMLTTGQATALTSLAASGSGFPFRIMTPDGIVTDQVWFAGLTEEAPEAARQLLAFLTVPDAQQALAAQGLHTVRDDLTLYAAGFSREVELTGKKQLCAINAFLSAAAVDALAWQAFQGTLAYADAVAGLL